MPKAGVQEFNAGVQEFNAKGGSTLFVGRSSVGGASGVRMPELQVQSCAMFGCSNISKTPGISLHELLWRLEEAEVGRKGCYSSAE